MFLGKLPIFDCLCVYVLTCLRVTVYVLMCLRVTVYMLTREEVKMDPAHPCPMGQAVYQRVCSDSEQRLSHQPGMGSTFGFTSLELDEIGCVYGGMTLDTFL